MASVRSEDRETHSTEISPRSRFGGLHLRTYEMELLISGALVFGLVHAPAVLQRWFDGWLAELAGELRIVGVLFQTYLQLMVYALIVTFVLHLIARGFWIGLLGLESVFPEGIRWNELRKMGATTKEHYRRNVRPLSGAVEWFDDLCSLIFSFGFFVGFTFFYFAAVFLVAALLAMLVDTVSSGAVSAVVVFWLTAGSVLAVQVLSEKLDQIVGSRLSPDGFLARCNRLLVKVGYSISLMRCIGTIQLTLYSNAKPAIVVALTVGVMVALAVFQVGGVMVGERLVRVDSLSYFPDGLAEDGLDPNHYRDLRSTMRIEPTVPTVQSELVTDPYVRLFLPYHPRRHNALLSTSCPDLEPLSPEGFQIGFGPDLDHEEVRTAAACLGGLYTVALDGTQLSDLHFDFTVDHDTGLKGVVTFLPVRELAHGRHELEVLAPSRDAPDDASAEPVRHVIPFWV